MSSLPQASILSMPPLERSHTELSPGENMSTSPYRDRVSPRAYRAAPFDSSQYQHPQYPYQQQQQYGYLQTPSYPAPSPYLPVPFGSYGFQPNPSQGMTFAPDFSCHNPYFNATPLPTLPPRFSASNPINIPGQTTGCISPLDLFGALPSAQSLPTNAMHFGAFGSRSLAGFGQDQLFLDEAVEIDDEAEAETTSGPEVFDMAESPVSSEAESMPEIEEMDDELEVEPVPEVGKVGLVKKAAKVRPAVSHTLEFASPSMKVKGVVEGSPGDAAQSKEGKKRSRTAQACERCRVRKARCFGGHPCNRCVKRKFTCEFTPTSTRARTLVVKPEVVASTTTTKPKARRHSVHAVSSTAASGHARSMTHPTPVVKAPTTRPAGAGHSHSHSHSMTSPRQRNEVPSAHPYLRPGASPAIGSVNLAAFALRNATTGARAAASSSGTASNRRRPGMDDGLELGLGLGLSLGVDLSPSPNTDDNLGGTSASASNASAPASHSGTTPSSGVTGTGSGRASLSGWSSAFTHTGTTEGTPSMMAEDDIFQLSPVQPAESEQLSFEWGVSGGDGYSGFDAGTGHQGFTMEGMMMDQGSTAFMAGNMGSGSDLYTHNQGAGFRA